MISADRVESPIQWVYGGKRSLVTGAVPELGKDGPFRLHVKVRTGDLVLFADSTVVFENGKDELDKVWEIAEFQDGSKVKLGSPNAARHKAYYKGLDGALITQERVQDYGRHIALIRIKALTADHPILFTSGRVSHIEQPRGNKHYMFGAIELDTSAR